MAKRKKTLINLLAHIVLADRSRNLFQILEIEILQRFFKQVEVFIHWAQKTKKLKLFLIPPFVPSQVLFFNQRFRS